MLNQGIPEGSSAGGSKRTLDPRLLDHTDITLFQPAPAWSLDDEAGPNWAPFGASPMMPGKDTPQVAALLGQSSKTGTDRYARTSPGDGSGAKSPSTHDKDQLKKLNGTSSRPTRSRESLPPKATSSSPKRHRKSKRAVSNGGDRDAKATTHREGSLERNRIAAYKCRKRKKKWIHSLKERHSWLEKRYKDLGTEYFYLLQEISELKTLIIGHANCHDSNIDTWLNNEASKYVCKVGSDGPKGICGSRPAPSLDATSTSRPSGDSSQSQYTEPSNTSLQLESEDSNTSFDSDNSLEGDFDDNVARFSTC
ncbi:transcription factor [Metarhizium acridum]|uniref:transcription factor n=1 Tax=Metarhizium acridum TaxID=92637 RepID=UPI001C6CF7CD|nr:transcription factor [Metarhizium acridum]